MAMVYLVLPAFSKVLNQSIAVPWNNQSLWVITAGMIVVTGFLAGSYPAFYLSGFNPVKVLKGTFLPGKKAMLPRKILVTSQFIASIILISATLIIYEQLQYVKNRNVGYNQEHLLMVNSSPATDKNFDALRNDLFATGYVASVNRTSGPVTDIFMYTSGIKWPGASENTTNIVGFLFTDYDFTKTLQAKIVDGRDFEPGDTDNVIFNKAAIATMGMKEPVGKTIEWAGKERRIVGVIDNMIMTSPYAPADPLMLVCSKDQSRSINLRVIATKKIGDALSSIEAVYKKYSIDYPFEYKFVDEDFNKKFVNEQLIGKLSVTFAGLAIFICSLGLFGLVASSIERRKKELGIRKVLGASVRSLLILMSKEFLFLVLIAFLVAIPAAWWMMNLWLRNFSYRIDIGIGVFLLVGLFTLAIAMITISLNASKAALGNPVKTMRTE
jgi:putative ABC transport system permease protein